MKGKPIFVHKTSLGQNFLIDRNILGKIVENANISNDDVILEVGSGMGILTRELALKGCHKLYSLEIDKRLEEYLLPLEEEFSNLSLIWTDAVRFDYSSRLDPLPNKMIANLPYHITTPLLWKIFTSLVDKGLNYFILMLQKEAAERLCARPGTKERYPLGITIDAMGTAKPIMKVSPQSFRPVPRVDSVLLEIKLHKDFQLGSDPTWKRMLRAAFTQRRKTLINNLIPFIESIGKADLGKIMLELGIDVQKRPEQLTTDQWLNCFKVIGPYMKK